ncbi:MAG: T9SS type A sorting domain-containing protein [Ignavibacteriae bacterium]|nr:T9SS type A sorting domain-containing protein [Ignavibacteriota bacterium]
MQGTIPTNDNKVTITGIVYTNNSGEANVQLVTSAAGMADCMITTNFLAMEPLVQDADIKFENFSKYYSKDGATALTKMDISWTNGDGNKRVVLMSANTPIGTPELPLDGTGYTANSIFESGDKIGNAYAVFNDAGNTLTVTNLIEGTIYYVRVFGYNGVAALSNYNLNTTSGNPDDSTLVEVKETYIAEGFGVTAVSPNPAYLDIKFDLTISKASVFTIEIVDMQGRVITSYCNKKFFEDGFYQIAIPVSKLASGSYLLKIFNGTDFAYQVFTIVR